MSVGSIPAKEATLKHNMFTDARLPAKLAHQGSEDSLQMLCVEWLKKALLARKLPQEVLYHCPNGGKRHKREAMKFKLMGVRSGVPDLLLDLRNKDYSGLRCELKNAKGTIKPAQREFLTTAASQGFLAVVINDIETFKKVFTYYLDNI